MGAAVIARLEDLRAADQKKDPRRARGRVLEAIAAAVRKVAGPEPAPPLVDLTPGPEEGADGLHRTLGAVTTRTQLSEEQAREIEAKGWRVWRSAVREGGLVPYADPVKVHPDRWAIDYVGRDRIGVAPKGMPIGFLDSTMPVVRRPYRGVITSRRFPAGLSLKPLWHSCATTLLVTDDRLGMAPEATVVLAAVLTREEAGKVVGDPDAVVDGLRWLLHWRGAKGARIELINASIDAGPDGAEAIQALLDNAAAMGRRPVLVASSGNSAAPDLPKIAVPAALGTVIAVGAMTPERNVWERSGWRRGDEGVGRKPDLIAPGVSVRTIDAQGGWGARSGTSLAAPYVTGAIARLMATGLSAQDAVKVLLEKHVVPIEDERAGAGALCGGVG